MGDFIMIHLGNWIPTFYNLFIVGMTLGMTIGWTLTPSNQFSVLPVVWFVDNNFLEKSARFKVFKCRKSLVFFIIYLFVFQAIAPPPTLFDLLFILYMKLVILGAAHKVFKPIAWAAFHEIIRFPFIRNDNWFAFWFEILREKNLLHIYYIYSKHNPKFNPWTVCGIWISNSKLNIVNNSHVLKVWSIITEIHWK